MGYEPIDRACALQALEETGCPPELTEQVLQALERQNLPGALGLLAGQRRLLLEQLHADQRRLDRLDDLRYALEQQANPGGKPGRKGLRPGTF